MIFQDQFEPYGYDNDKCITKNGIVAFGYPF